MLDYAVWCLVVPYLDVRSVVRVRRVHRDGRHSFPRDEARTLLRLVVNKSGKVRRSAMAELEHDHLPRAVFDLFFKESRVWGKEEATMCKNLQRYVDLRACHVGADGHVRVGRDKSRVVRAMYTIGHMRSQLVADLLLDDETYLLVATRGLVTVAWAG